jgi:CRISPR system Cascade subunit CasD
MAQYLLFTLAAPMASSGAVAVGERRPTWNRPSKSQTIGLIAAALGIERSDEARQRELADGLGFAVRTDHSGVLATDYHTAQVPPARRNRRFATRAEELAVAKTELKTILSRREFHAGSFYTIAVWRERQGDQGLDAIAAALRTPAFVPYAGRKAHPLMLPMLPHVIEAQDVESAFGQYDASQPQTVLALKVQLGLEPQSYRPICPKAATSGASVSAPKL